MLFGQKWEGLKNKSFDILLLKLIGLPNDHPCFGHDQNDYLIQNFEL